MNIGIGTRKMVSAVVLFSLFVFSCKYDTDIAHPEQYEKVYMSQAVDQPAVYNFVMSDTAQSIVYGASFGGTGYPNSDITVLFEADFSLVDSFNQRYNTNYMALPDGSFDLEEESAVIPKGETSTIPLHLKIKTYDVLEPAQKYLLPVRIAEAGNVAVSHDLGVSYFLISAKFEIVDVLLKTQDSDNPSDVVFSTSDAEMRIAYTAALSGVDPGADVKVDLQSDPTLVDAFNEQHGTEYLPMPEGSFNLSETSTTIPTGGSTSEALTIDVTQPGDLTPFTKYLLPVSISHVSADLATSKQVQIDNENGTAYFVIQLVTELVDPDKSYTDLARDTWEVIDYSDYSAYENTVATNTIDGDVNSFWGTSWKYYHSANPNWITIDMHDINSLHGFYLYPRQGYGLQARTPEDIHIDVSTDNINWMGAGDYHLAFPSQNDRLNIYMKYTMDVRYVKITINKSISDYEGVNIAEIGAF